MVGFLLRLGRSSLIIVIIVIVIGSPMKDDVPGKPLPFSLAGGR